VTQAYGEEEPLCSAGLEELLPLVGVPHGEGDGVDPVLELGGDGARPRFQLQVRWAHFRQKDLSAEGGARGGKKCGGSTSHC